MIRDYTYIVEDYEKKSKLKKLLAEALYLDSYYKKWIIITLTMFVIVLSAALGLGLTLGLKKEVQQETTVTSVAAVSVTSCSSGYHQRCLRPGKSQDVT